MTGQRDEPERVFEAFVRNANRSGAMTRTVRAPSSPPPSPATSARRASTPPPITDRERRRPLSDMPPGPGEATQIRQADQIVPRVAAISIPPPPPREGSEGGQMPAGELDRAIVDMGVLLRYGHANDVRARFDALLGEYPHDLLLARRIAEFWIEQQHVVDAREALFRLAAGLFQRGNAVGMRRALEEVLVLEPGNERAMKLLGLLERRSKPPTPPAR